MKSEQLRWAIFTPSIVSAVNNPGAHLWRRVGSLLTEYGHEATFFEERGNQALRALLQQSGAGALAEFRRQLPMIQYRTFDARGTFEIAEWLSRTLSTIDIAVVQPGAPNELITLLGEFTRPYLQTFLVDCGWTQSPTAATETHRDWSRLTGILVADERVASDYTRTLPKEQVHRFGPLPETASIDAAIDESTDTLNSAAIEIVETILSMSQRIRSSRGSQLLPNGRSDQRGEPPTGHEPV